jgi:hypothetical protein
MESQLHRFWKSIIHHYNERITPTPFTYQDQFVVFQQMTSKLPTIVTHTDDAHKISSNLFSNKHHKTMKMEFIKTFSLSDHLGSCHLKLQIGQCDPQTILEKITIKGVDMNKLMRSMNKQNIKTKEILDLLEVNPSLDALLKYFESNHIDYMSLINIMFKHNVTVDNLLSNPFIFGIIEQSSNYKWILSMATAPVKPSISAKSIEIYMIFKIKQDQIIISNINYYPN